MLSMRYRMRSFSAPLLSASLFAFLIVLPLPASAQAAGSVESRSVDPAATRAYIHNAWDQLSRSVTDCQSLSDVKVTTRPILYLPHELTTPEAVKTLAAGCAVKIVSLPKQIGNLGDLMPQDLTKAGLAPGLLYLPNKYIVPGGRFNDMYGWDSYFIILGVVA